MSYDVGENTYLKERRRKCRLSTFCRIIFGCIAKVSYQHFEINVLKNIFSEQISRKIE